MQHQNPYQSYDAEHYTVPPKLQQLANSRNQFKKRAMTPFMDSRSKGGSPAVSRNNNNNSTTKKENRNGMMMLIRDGSSSVDKRRTFHTPSSKSYSDEGV